MTKRLPQPYLYILARNDLESLNPGKLAAQAAHAANAAQTFIANGPDSKRFTKLRELWADWAGDRGFGVTITLEVPAYVLEKLNIEQGDHRFNWEDSRPIVYGAILDPSYPVKDGSITHLVPLVTTGFVFGDKNKFDVTSITGTFNLYP
jgi:hypothetical protein